jgi:hypothetical protein
MLIFLIKDQKDVVWGIAPSELQAKIQIQWHLPKGNSYKIESMWTSNKGATNA